MNKDLRFVIFSGVVVALIVLGLLLIPPAKADIITFGSELNYSAVVLPNNSYVHQGENISQGNYYDLRGIYGFSGVVAHWKNSGDEGITPPETTVSLIHPEKVYIDPAVYPPGRYYQFDGASCDPTNSWCSNSFGNDNAYVFAVVAPAEPAIAPVTTRVYNSTIWVSSDNGSVEIPVTVVMTVQQTPLPAQITGATTIVIPTPSTPVPDTTVVEEITPRGDVPPLLSIFALVIGGFLLCRRR